MALIALQIVWELENTREIHLKKQGYGIDETYTFDEKSIYIIFDLVSSDPLSAPS